MDKKRGQGMNKNERIEEEVRLKSRIKELKEEKKTVREIMDILNISTGKYYKIIRSDPTKQLFSNSEEDRKRREAIERFKEEYEELKESNRQKYLMQLTESGRRTREIIKGMKIGEAKQDIKNFIRNEVSNVISENRLKEKLSLAYPEIEFSRELIEKSNNDEKLKIKEVEGLGIYFYYSKQGKIQFHEYILKIIIEKIKKMKIRYRKPTPLKGEDLRVKDYYIELEVNAIPNKQLYKRQNLKNRVLKHPENTIIITLNKEDKEQYRKYYTELLHKYKRIFTIPEFLAWIKKENQK
jgi:hypothetical protein